MTDSVDQDHGDNKPKPARPIVWMRAVRDAKPKPGPRSARREVLWALALRLNADGTGFASEAQLAADTERGISTVRRQLAWARANRYLTRTRRGHRLNADTVIASEWQLTIPPQPVTGDGLEPVGDQAQPPARDLLEPAQPPTGERYEPNPTAQMGRPNRSDGAAQPPAPEPPRGLQPEVTQQQAALAVTVQQNTDATGAEAAAVVDLITRHRQPANLAGLVAHLGRAGDLPRWLNQVRAEHRRADQRTAPHCPHHRGQPAHNCSPCRAEQLASDPNT